MRTSHKTYWHLCSDELPDGLIFRNEKEYIFGMNSIPIALQSTSITIYCFTLMSNHFHFLLSGTYQEAVRFFTKLKQHLGILLSEDGSSPLRGLKPKLVEASDEELFRIEVAYIMRNCAAAGICDPYNYRWGTGYLYFNPRIRPKGAVRVGDLQVHEVRNIINSRIRVPDGYLIYDGIILPESYVDYKKVEELFNKPLELFTMLKTWNLEQKEVYMTTGVDKEFYDDETVLKKIKEELGIDDIKKLKIWERKMKVPVFRNKFGCSVKQICRIANLDEVTVRKLCPW